MSLTPGQLPVRLTPLVGRESELDDIVQALRRTSALASYDAVKLFEQRAQLVRPSFR